MITKLRKAIDAAESLPQPQQDAIADLLLEAVARARIDEKIAAGERSFLADGGSPAADVFERLTGKYAD